MEQSKKIGTQGIGLIPYSATPKNFGCESYLLIKYTLFFFKNTYGKD